MGLGALVALVGCGGGRWSLPEDAQAVVSRTAAEQQPNATLEWPSGLPGDSGTMLDEIALALSDVGHYLVEVDKRHAQALTEEERGRLSEVRHDTIERLFQDLTHLQAVLTWWRAQGATQQLALVFADVDAPPAGVRPLDPRTQPVQFSHLAVLETQERPAGVYWRGVSLPLALRALRDGIVDWARGQGALSPESRERLLPAR